MHKLRRGHVCRRLRGKRVYKLLGGYVLKCCGVKLHALYCRQLLGGRGYSLFKLQFRDCSVQLWFDELCEL